MQQDAVVTDCVIRLLVVQVELELYFIPLSERN